MKILRIKGANLASLEGEFEVDFMAEPLRSAGIFAITGSTGSGKSTLLDAICLALYNDTPRINRVRDKADIKDVKNLTIKPTDSRNILRRGASMGYAQVDFISLSGDTIRAVWSVRRSKDRADGSLQKVAYKVFNITTDSEYQGGKTQLLATVCELIGLTFDQFTRAVLLAQGDFATFLKAEKNEKAELLEKLTGTDIYSRISSKIYDNTKVADAELALVTMQIENVEVLTEDQVVELRSEYDGIVVDVAKLGGEVDTLSKKCEWVNTYEKLTVSLSGAQNELSKCKEAVYEATSRFSYVGRVDSVQQIRDDFKQLLNDKSKLKIDEKTVEDKQKSNRSNSALLHDVNEEFKHEQESQDVLNKRWQEQEPQVKEARKLDTQLEGLSNSISENEAELTQAIDKKHTCNSAIAAAEKGIKAANESLNNISSWFESNKHYADVVSKIDLILAYIDNCKVTKKQVEDSRKSLERFEKLLATDTKQLEELKVEEARLNDILPAEIASLRAKLEDNKPCMVCGSVNHPIGNVIVDSVKEEQLNRDKKVVATLIDTLTLKITDYNNDISRLKAEVKANKEQYDISLNKLTVLLDVIPDWNKKYNSTTMKPELQSVVRQWLSNTTQQAELTDKLNVLNKGLEMDNKRFVELSQALGAIEAKKSELLVGKQNLQGARDKLLDGQQADAVENRYKKEQAVISDKITSVVSRRDLLIVKNEKIAGVIAQLSSNISTYTVNIARLEATVSKWLSNRKDGLNIEELTELLSKDSSWLVAERSYLDKLISNELSANTILKERQRLVDTHNMADIIPADEETKDLLLVLLGAKEEELKKRCERQAEVTALFVSHEKGQERIKKFEVELTKKGSVAENWQKLNELFGSADGAKFKVLAQGYTLDVLLGYANKHLHDISKRYKLERVSSDSLSLQVVDLDMFSEVRSVHSLSGGESFLISLALALGLSSLSSNRMSIESLFIDEGFGTLDADTLRVAMDALESLQTQGRKIGVISHVAEMTERIATQIKVVKSSNGRSHIEVM